MRNVCTAKSILKNENGLTLVEVMIVSGVMIVLALGFATMMSNVGRQQKTIEVKGNLIQLSNGVRGLASTPTAIQLSLEVTD
jgi:competence protein ComGC